MKNEITKILGQAKWVLFLGICFILFIPLILTSPAFSKIFDFTSSGQIGDTIGGTTAPFLNLVGAILIFLALKAQVKANELIQEQIDRENETKSIENEVENLNKLYSYLNESVNNFKFTTLPIKKLKNTGNLNLNDEVTGGDAFFKLFHQVRCHYHGTQKELFENQSISELYSVLMIMSLLLDRIDENKTKNSEILTTLIRHQFLYKITTRIREESFESLQVVFCPNCQCNHGLPDELRSLIGKIKQQLNVEQ